MKKIQLGLGLGLILSLLSLQGVAQKQSLNLEDVVQKRLFTAQLVYGINSMNDGEFYTSVEGHGEFIVKHSFKTGDAVDTLFSVNAPYVETENKKVDADAQIKYIEGYDLSSDESKIVITTNSEPIFRHSFKAFYYIFDTKTKILIPVSAGEKQELATLSPDGSKVAFVSNNNLFLVDLASGKQQQLTTDGEYNKIINGATDWVYEEEFGFAKGFTWSPDSRRIAFYRFDESQVPLFNMTMYEHKLYPINYTFKYPKAGEKNSIVTIKVYTLDNGKTVQMDVGPETNQYVARIKWTPDAAKLSMIRMNRLQNQLDIMLADPDNGASTIAYQEKSERFIEEVDDSYLTFTPDSKEFIITSEKSGWRHIYHYDITGKQLYQVTAGNWDVTAILGFDPKAKLVYYQAAEESPLRRNVYAVKLDGTKKHKLSEQEGTNSAIFSTGCKYYINTYSSIATPPLVTLHSANGKLIRVLKDNAKLKELLTKYVLPAKTFYTFKTAEGVVLNGYMVKPANFDSTKHYPVLMTQYSGPDSQEVLDRWGIGWDEVLASEGYIVACVDPRGTGARGEEFRKMTYGQLGKYETIDQVEAAKYLQSLSYVDSARIGIWGWSYGGFMTLTSLMKGNDVFKMGIAVAPVTNWRYYDSIYTERFMGLPQDNASGYDDNSPINHVDELKAKLLIVCGSGDDNVHMQNSFELISRLIEANKQYDMMVYPDKNHSIYGGNTRYHLYTKLNNYVLQNL
jgi:Dipeptidyl aminopeptidases/acylaminoacyl-peptidases